MSAPLDRPIRGSLWWRPTTPTPAARVLASGAALIAGVASLLLVSPWPTMQALAALFAILSIALVPLLIGMSPVSLALLSLGPLVAVVLSTRASMDLLSYSLGLATPVLFAIAPVAVVAILLLVMVATSRLRRAVYLGILTSCCAALLWPLPLFVAFEGTANPMSAVVVLALISSPFAVAVLLANFTESRAMRGTTWLLDARDVLVRTFGSVAAILVGFSLAAVVERALRSAFVGTPLESVVHIAGWCVGALSIVAITYIAWRLPGSLARAQFHGRFSSRAVGDALWLIALLAGLATFSSGQIAASLLLLVIAVIYALVRLWLSVPAAPSQIPLWVIATRVPTRRARNSIGGLTRAWTAGPVTLLATPESAPRLAQAHARLSKLADRLGSLFPKRSAQAEDWDGGLPDRHCWSAVPLRELYAPAALWPEILRTRLEPHAQVIVLEVPAPAARSQRSRAIPRAYRVPVSSAARVNDATSARELESIAWGGIESIERLRDSLRELQAHLPRRRFIILHAREEGSIASELCKVLREVSDPAGAALEAWPVLIDPTRLQRFPLWPAPLGFSTHGFELMRRARLRDGAARARRGSLFGLSLMSRPDDSAYELVIIEPPTARTTDDENVLDFFRRLAERRAFDRIVAVREAQGQIDSKLTLDPTAYSGEIRWHKGATLKAGMEEVARRLLASRFDVVAPSQTTSHSAPDREETAHANEAESFAGEPTESQQRERTSASDRLSLPHAAPVTYAAFAPDGETIVTACRDGNVKLWSTASGRPTGVAFPHEGTVRHAAFDSQGVRLATCGEDSLVHVWDVISGESLLTLIGHDATVAHVQFSVDGRRIASAGGIAARLWDASSGELIALLPHEANVIMAKFSPDGRHIVTCGFDNTARLWNGETGASIGEPLRHVRTVRYAEFSPDGRYVVTASEDRSARIWDVRSCEPIGKIVRHRKAIKHAIFSPDGASLLTASEDGEALIWDSTSGEPLSRPFVHSLSVNCVAFSPDGSEFASACEDGCVRRWNPTEGALIGEPMRLEGAVFLVSYNESANWMLAIDSSNDLKVWRRETLSISSESMEAEAASAVIA